MKARQHRIFIAVVTLLSLLMTFSVGAQDTNDDDMLEPAVDTSAALDDELDESQPSVSTPTNLQAERDALEPSVSTPTELQAERDALVPGVTSAVLAQDVTRDESGSRVMDSIELGRTEITGNQELPKVLYIVPWQKSDPEDLMGRPVNTLLDEVLAPLDREEFLRQVSYYDDLYGDKNE